MKQYLLLVFGVCLVSGAIRVISPEGAMKKHIEMLCSLCLAAAVVIPLVSMISGMDGEGMLDGILGGYETQDYEKIYGDYVVSGNMENVEAVMAEELAEMLDVNVGDITVGIILERQDDTCKVTNTYVILRAGAVACDPDIIKDHVYERLGIECEIIYSINDEK